MMNQRGVEAARNEEASSFLTTSEMGTQLGFGTFRSLSLSPAQLLEAAGVFRWINPRPMPSWLTGTQKGKADASPPITPRLFPTESTPRSNQLSSSRSDIFNEQLAQTLIFPGIEQDLRSLN